MNSHAYLAKRLIELGDKYSNEPLIKLLSYHRAFEEYVIAKLISNGVKEEYPSILNKMIDKIKEDKELYEIYSDIIDEMFNYVITQEVSEGKYYEKIKSLITTLSED